MAMMAITTSSSINVKAQAFLSDLTEEEGLKILEILKKNDQGLQSAIIGRVVSDHPGKVVLKNETGGRRIVDSLSGDQLPRIC